MLWRLVRDDCAFVNSPDLQLRNRDLREIREFFEIAVGILVQGLDLADFAHAGQEEVDESRIEMEATLVYKEGLHAVFRPRFLVAATAG